MAVKDLKAQYAGTNGNQLQAAGALIYAQDTGNVLVVYRSPAVVDPCLWCGIGGKIEPGETPEQASRREIAEEVGYKGEMTQLPIFVWDKPELKFYNFIGVVPSQFQPALNWETSGYVWCKPNQIPGPIHYGLQAVLDDPYSTAKLADAQSQTPKENTSTELSFMRNLEVLKDSPAPKYQHRYAWITDKVLPLTKKFGLEFDNAISDEQTLLFYTKSPKPNVETQLVDALSKELGLKFADSAYKGTTFNQISRRQSLGADTGYMQVSKTLRDYLTLKIVL